MELSLSLRYSRVLSSDVRILDVLPSLSELVPRPTFGHSLFVPLNKVKHQMSQHVFIIGAIQECKLLKKNSGGSS